MNIDQVYEKEGKWYCKNCDREINKYEYSVKMNSKKYKIGDIKISWKHKNKSDSISCNKKGKKHTFEFGQKISKSKKGKPSWNKGKKCNNISTALKGKKLSKEHCENISKSKKGKPSWNKGKYLSENHKRKLRKPKSEEAKKNMSKGQKGKIITQKHRDSISNSIKNKTLEQKLEKLRKEIETKKKNGTLTTSKPEKNSIVKMNNTFLNDFIAHPTKDQLIKINSKLINYPGCSPDGFLISKMAFIEFQYHWSHGGHPYNPRNSEDKYQAEFYKNKVKQGHNFYSKAYNTFINNDPLKRKWCKDNGFNLIEFWSEKEVDEFIENKGVNKC